MTSSRTSAAASRPIPRRGLRRDEAAAYLGVSPSKFDTLVADRRMPPPRMIDGCVIWDVREIDDAFDDLPRRGDARAAAMGDPDDPWSQCRV